MRKPTAYQRLVLEQLVQPGSVTTRWSDGDYVRRPDGVSTKIHPRAFTTMIRERWVEESLVAIMQRSYAITRAGRIAIGVDCQGQPAASERRGAEEGGSRVTSDDPICYVCDQPAENNQGTIYVRALGPDARCWVNIAICTPCWELREPSRVPVRVIPRSQWPPIEDDMAPAGQGEEGE